MPGSDIKKIIDTVPELSFLQKEFNRGDYKKMYTRVMTMDQEEVNEKLRPLIERITPLYESGKLTKDNPHYWAAKAALAFQANGNIDRGIFSIYVFNIVRMKKGEALFQDAGLPHAYLEGYTIEIMANSDNVLRGGLTSKHIDVNELLEHIRFVPTHPKIIATDLEEDKTAEQVFITPAHDFQLSRILVKEGEGISLPAKKTDIYFIYRGTLTAIADEQRLAIASGVALLAVPGTVVHFAAESDSVIYRATEPIV
jgi:mannose-6-phosphate isomerase